VVYKGKQERRIVSDDVTRERHPNELIVEVVIPSIHGTYATAFARVGRTSTDEALLNVATLIEIKQDLYTRVRLAFGGVHMEPIRLFAVERALEGQSIDDATSIMTAVQRGMAEFRPPTDVRVSGGYRRVSGAKLAQRVLEEATYLARHQGLLVAQSGKSKENKE
jgi:CO/xanthine dehydrogenase FAD-binding subunit